MLPLNTANIIFFLKREINFEDFELLSLKGVISFEYWNSDKLGPQPTEQEIIDAANDLTIVDGQTFSEWWAENGGNKELTIRRKARESIDNNKELIALTLAMMDEINILRQQNGLPPRGRGQLIQAIKNKVE